MNDTRKKIILILAQYPDQLQRGENAGWVGKEHIEQEKWCPYSLKTAKNHRGKYLPKPEGNDEFIEVGTTGVRNKRMYRLRRNTQTWAKLSYIFKDNDEFFKSPYYWSISLEEEEKEKFKLLDAVERIRYQINQKTISGNYSHNHHEMKSLIKAIQDIKQDVESSEAFEKMMIDDEKILKTQKRYVKEGMHPNEAFMKAERFVLSSPEKSIRGKNSCKEHKRQEFLYNDRKLMYVLLKEILLEKKRESLTRSKEASAEIRKDESSSHHIFFSLDCGATQDLKFFNKQAEVEQNGE